MQAVKGCPCVPVVGEVSGMDVLRGKWVKNDTSGLDINSCDSCPLSIYL